MRAHSPQSSESEADTGTASSLASSARSSTESLNEHIQEVSVGQGEDTEDGVR